MPSGLYIAASGMNSTINRENVISNNLANLNTVGFKQDRSIDVAFPTYLISRLHDQRVKVMDGTAELRPNIGLMGGGVLTKDVVTDTSQGSRVQTNDPLDFALTGTDYYFSVLGPDGRTMLTRDGSFSLDGNGRLVTKDGLPVLGHNGEINIDGSQVTADAEGNITVDGKGLDQLLVVKADPGNLAKAGHSLFAVQTPGRVDMASDNIQVQQGSLEQSNVNGIQEMIHMIEVSRSYEMNAKIVTMYDGVLDQGARMGDTTNITVY